jgi:hypothetical protein
MGGNKKSLERPLFLVIPAKAGTQCLCFQERRKALDPSVRWGDGSFRNPDGVRSPPQRVMKE